MRVKAVSNNYENVQTGFYPTRGVIQYKRGGESRQKSASVLSWNYGPAPACSLRFLAIGIQRVPINHTCRCPSFNVVLFAGCWSILGGKRNSRLGSVYVCGSRAGSFRGV